MRHLFIALLFFSLPAHAQSQRTDPVFFNEITNKTADYTFTLQDRGDHLRFDSSGNLTATVPTNANEAFEPGDWLTGAMWGGGTLTFSSGGSVTLNGTLTFSSSGFAAQYKGSDIWDVYGGS